MSEEYITRKEAIELAKFMVSAMPCGKMFEKSAEKAVNAIPAADVVSAEAYKQIMWERETAIAQLAEYGVGLGEKKDVAPVVHEPCEFCAGTLYNDYALENVNGKYPKIVSCASANRQLGRGQKRFKYCPNCGRKLDMDERSDA